MVDLKTLDVSAALAALGPEYSDSKLAAITTTDIAQSPRKVVVLDDDPTGTQTVHGVEVITQWSEETFASLLQGPDRTFYVLTNSRSMPECEAVALNRDIISSLCRASHSTGTEFTIVSRSDSTLRGHFPAEIQAAQDAVFEELGRSFDATVLIPAFFEGGRYTFGDVHWVESNGKLIPAGQTEFARDPVFSYQSSNLRYWVEEKTAGAVKASQVTTIPISTIRDGGPAGVLALLDRVHKGGVIIANAASYSDLQVLTSALLSSEKKGKQYIYRTAASFVPIYSGIPLRSVLTRDELLDATAVDVTAGGLVVVGSHVSKSTTQLRHLLKLPNVSGIELNVTALLSDAQRDAEIQAVASAARESISRGQDTVIYTSRQVAQSGGAEGYLNFGKIISSSLVKTVRQIGIRPRFFIAKGGITSSTMATDALGAVRARVMGQIIPGVPVWRMGPETSMPGVPFVVFPGNVGSEEALAEITNRLRHIS